MTCLTCAGEAEPTPDAKVLPGASEGATPTPSVSEVSTPAPAAPESEAGGSAMREYERRKPNGRLPIRTRHPGLGGLILFLSDEPQSTTSWAKGAVGEQTLGAGLDSLAAAGVGSLHDRRIPGSKANIDHLAMRPARADNPGAAETTTVNPIFQQHCPDAMAGLESGPFIRAIARRAVEEGHREQGANVLRL